MNDPEKPFVNQACLLQKFSGKGGWTYVAIPPNSNEKLMPPGWSKVTGSIDDFELTDYNLMPMGDGTLFLPVKAEIRKKIGKQEGDWVNVVLYTQNSRQMVEQELMLCLEDEPAALKAFLKSPKTEQKAHIDWIFSSYSDEVKIERIIKTIDSLLRRKTLPDKKAKKAA